MRDPAQAAVVQLLQAAVGTVYPAAVLCSGRHTVELEVAVGAASPQTWFDLASLTKALSTSVLAMQLHDAEKLTLEDEVLPGVRVWHLLSHCSGLPACFPPLYAQHQGLLDAPSVHTRQAVVRAAQAATRTPVATQAVYSDLGFILLGDFLEQRGQARLDQQLEQWLQPLGLALSFLPLTGEKPQPVDCAQTRRESSARELLTAVVHDDTARAMLGVAGHAGLFGTARAVFDLAQLLLACYHGDRAAQHALRVSAATVQRFFAPVLVPGLRTTWGLGWDHPDPHPPAGSDAGSTSSAGRLWSRAGVGHLGFTGCSVWLDPALHAVAVLVSNRVCVATSAEAEHTKAGMRRLRPQLHDTLMQGWQQPR